MGSQRIGHSNPLVLKPSPLPRLVLPKEGHLQDRRGALPWGALLGCNQKAEPKNDATEQAFQPVGGSVSSPSSATVRLGEAERVLGPGYLFPAVSPDGRWIAVTRAGLDGLWIDSTTGGSVSELTRAPRSVYMHRWRQDSAVIAHRDRAQSTDALSVTAPGWLTPV